MLVLLMLLGAGFGMSEVSRHLCSCLVDKLPGSPTWRTTRCSLTASQLPQKGGSDCTDAAIPRHPARARGAPREYGHNEMPCVTIAFESSPGGTRTSFSVVNAHRDAWKIKVNSDNWIVKHLLKPGPASRARSTRRGW